MTDRTQTRTPITNSRKAGIAAGLLASNTLRNRWVRAGYMAGASFFQSIWRIVSILWLQITGVFFLLFSLIGGGAAIREYNQWTQTQSQGDRNSMAAGLAICILFGYFAVTSFWKARRR